VKALAAGVACACALLAAACGLPANIGGPPSAQDILSRPAGSDLRDAHFTISGTPGEGLAGVQVQGDGDVVFRPRLAYHLAVTTSLGAVTTAGEILSVAGSSYQRTGGGRWQPGPAAIVPAALAAWSGATGGRYVGEEVVDGSRCWHVSATSGTQPLQLWVREPDGFPARSQVGQLVVDYGRFNRHVAIAPPPASALQPAPMTATAKVAEAAHLNGVDVTVAGVNLRYVPANRALRPRAGDRFVLAEVVYVLTGKDRLSYGPVQWRLTDARGANYEPAFLDREPRLGLGELTAQGQQARGFLAYEVATAATGLRLEGAIGSDRVTVALP
jgi:uncharacterized protein DUF4352